MEYPGTPPRIELYENLDAEELAVFLAALNGTITVDVTCDAAGAVTGVTAKR